MDKTNMMQEFFGKPFKWALLGMVGLFAISALGYFAHVSLILLIILFAATGIATWKRTEYGLLIACIELLTNAHGYILYAPVHGFMLSARMTIFLGVFVGWGIALMQKRSVFPSVRDGRFVPFVVLLVGFVSGVLMGLLRRSALSMFQDANAYLSFAYLLPILSVEWDSLKQRVILQCLAAATVLTSAMSLLILYAFTHLPQGFLRVMYVYLRDIRFAEMTNLGTGLYRVFEQTQVFAFVFGFLLLERLFRTLSKKDRAIAMLGSALVFVDVILGMSRSFLVGFAAAVVLMFVWLILTKRTSIKTWIAGFVSAATAFGVSLVLLFCTVSFPLPHPRPAGEYLSGVFGERVQGTDAAVTSRWNLLTPMLELVKSSPIFGNGFGQTVTYISNDPRIRATNPDGVYVTPSMEWGWLELWVKMGIFGPLGFIALFVFLVQSASSLFRTEKGWVGIWVVESLVFLYFTHFFSPYLNHPIGIGLILMAVIFLPASFGSVSFGKCRAKQKVRQATLAAPVVTSQSE